MPAEIAKVLTDNPAQTAGWLIIGGLVLQVGLLLGQGARRYFFEQRRAALELARLELEIKAAQSRIKTVEQAKFAWNGMRKFTVQKKVVECADTFSFHLVPHDGKPLPPFKPGQYLTFQLALPGMSKPLVRCYSLSDCARPKQYRITIKRAPAPTDAAHPGPSGSAFFCDMVKEGDILDVKAPNGHFHLDLEKERPVVLISGGVGVTPMISMVNALTEAGVAREIWFFFGAGNSQEHLFKTHMAELAEKHPNVQLHVCYSRPRPDDVKGRDYTHEGRISVDLIKQLLPSSNYEYFLCGPGPFMESITTDLRAWGVPDEWVHFEAFGPASVKRAVKPDIKQAMTVAPFNHIEVTFAKSRRTALWSGMHASLLELAEECGVKIDAGCRAGNCGSCLVAIKSGAVEYLGGHGADAERGSCLTCICMPKGKLVIDA